MAAMAVLAAHKPKGRLRPDQSSAPLLLMALVALGVTSIASQIVLLREFLSVFYGNELVIGIVLTNWMILTGLGSFLGKFGRHLAHRTPPAILTLIGIALLPMITVTLLRLLRNLVFIPGSMIGITQAFAASLVLLAPFCLLSGFSFALLAAGLVEDRGRNPVALAYSVESLGSALGGAVFTLLILPWLDTFPALALLLAVDLGLAFLLAYRGRHRRLQALCLSLLLATTLGLGLLKPDGLTRGFLFPGQELLAFQDTPYGNLTVTRQGEQLNFFENTMLMSSTSEVAATEESVHLAMAQHPRPQDVLLIGGGISGASHEILKYPVTALDLAEVNPWIIDLGRTFTKAFDDPKIRVILDDARRYVRQSTRRYDVVLINLPDPETAHLNRYFTVEFFQELKRVLKDGALIGISLLPAAEYQGPEAKLLSSSLQATLKHIFATVLIVPGGRNYFLASDGPLDIHIGQLIEQRGVSTAYVNRYYLDDRMLEDRSREISASLDLTAPLNTDFTPVCYFQQLALWLSSLGDSTKPWLLLCLVALLMLASKSSAIHVGVFVSGFCASSFEMTLLLAFGALYGSLYQMTGLVVTAFMSGLAAGSWAIRRFARQAHIGSFILLQLVVAASGLLLALLLCRLQGQNLPPSTVHLLFSGLAFAVAALVGMEFAVAAQIRTENAATVASELYGLDLAGSAVGALLVTVYAIPLLGITKVCLLLGLLSALSGGLCLLRRRRYQISG